MTQNEFMTQLTNELRRRRVTDAADVAEEYAQHFAFGLADGYSEEEIAAKLGDPVEIAAQFEVRGDMVEAHGGRSPVLTWLWLCWVDLFFGLFAVLLFSFGIVLAACVLAFGMTGVCLIADLGRLPFVALPPMPYWCGLILGISLLALCVLFVVGCIWFFSLYRGMLRAYGRFHRNILAPCRGTATLPALPVIARFSAVTKRRLRRVTMISLAVFAVFFVLAYAACCLSAGSPAFWHAWGWFGYTA